MNLMPKRFFLDDFFDDFKPELRTNNMKCDIYEKDDKYYIEMDVPGYNKDNISITSENGYLTITASTEDEHEEESKNYIRKERSYGKYQRQFYIGNVSEDDIDAEFKDGILRIVVPKEKEIDTKKKIEIK